MKKERCYKWHTQNKIEWENIKLVGNVIILTDSVIHVEPVFGSPLIVHLVVPRLGNNPAIISANFEFDGCYKEELVERGTKNQEKKSFAERSHFLGALA